MNGLAVLNMAVTVRSSCFATHTVDSVWNVVTDE